jgi:hypothetical protein
VKITQDLLKDLFHYENGKLFNKTKRNGRALAREEAGSLISAGYRVIKINRKQYLSHRLIYIYHNGEIPDNLYIDHIDRAKLNNSIENLRLVTNQENQFNTDAKGYCFHKASNKFQVRIRLNGKHIYLGLFNTEDEARNTYLEAKKRLHIIKERVRED